MTRYDEDYYLLMAQVARARRDWKDVDYWMEQAEQEARKRMKQP